MPYANMPIISYSALERKRKSRYSSVHTASDLHYYTRMHTRVRERATNAITNVRSSHKWKRFSFCKNKWFIDWFTYRKRAYRVDEFLLFSPHIMKKIGIHSYILREIPFFSILRLFIMHYAFFKWNKIELQWNCRHFSCFVSFIL